ncbi:splicing factor 3B subunit 1 [Allomyces macrogynus ATCC 38327]|uniref:Splicing factor 3B subunit 1 n=1 Tax=Allomyces macrogynus (strain ATCC 38327) TaxID=578462 RepID=A0A0L0TFC7_ALLM3|nr:splicing factor 3B subunit 1 [Allomyces macrogynus ATCC 38327]|eukprot:KNE73405.1 splicing factor 3B subunit 1 [Allomyces macrogynus ATCC 38327]
MPAVAAAALVDLPMLKQEDMQFFGKLLEVRDEGALSIDELKERKILRLLLKIKNGTPPVRKVALRQITDKARDFGPGPLFNQILPLLMSPALEDQERHLLVKVIDRVLYKLDDLVRPYVHKILVVIEPLLIDEDYYARVEGREIISNLAKAAGLATMIATMRPDIDHVDEYVRNTTARAFAVVASALGIPALLPFLKAVCRSKKSWQARHTGAKIIQQIAVLMGEQTTEDVVMLNAFGTVVNALGTRVHPYLAQIFSMLKWRLANKSAKVRQQTADLVARIAVVLRTCGEEGMLSNLGQIFYENLGEEYPEVLGSILGALKAVVNVIGMANMEPPIRDLLPRLTPILRNRHEKVQENVIDLVGRIADRGAEHVAAREWMRICFELLDMLKAHRKAIRRAAVNTFGYIAKAIGPQDVLGTLLSNLKVQERQNRVCTTVAIAIVAETCSPFTVLPALMCEYRVPELNVQNGVLKSLSFMFEYIGEMGKDYVYAVTALLEDALIDRDLVHRQTACTTVKHLALGVAGLNCEDAMVHLLNHVWPNIFETSPHVINAVMDAIEALRVPPRTGRVAQLRRAGLVPPGTPRARRSTGRSTTPCISARRMPSCRTTPRIGGKEPNRWGPDELYYF